MCLEHSLSIMTYISFWEKRLVCDCKTRILVSFRYSSLVVSTSFTQTWFFGFSNPFSWWCQTTTSETCGLILIKGLISGVKLIWKIDMKRVFLIRISVRGLIIFLMLLNCILITLSSSSNKSLRFDLPREEFGSPSFLWSICYIHQLIFEDHRWINQKGLGDLNS